MRQKKVWRYYCEFCGKGGCACGHMKQHEKHCTANPNRSCRMCHTAKRDYKQLIAELRKRGTAMPYGGSEGEGYVEAGKDAIDWLEKIVDGCPACMLAAFRQSTIFPVTTNWDFKSAVQEWWNEKAAVARQEEDERNAAMYSAGMLP